LIPGRRSQDSNFPLTEDNPAWLTWASINESSSAGTVRWTKQNCGLSEKLRSDQVTFEKTGGLHAAGLFSANGELLEVREDIGRHNAVDKIVDWAVQQKRLPLSEHILLVSGRGGFELAQKAIAAGIPIMASVSAPSALRLGCRGSSG
jgi:FdhD protein